MQNLKPDSMLRIAGEQGFIYQNLNTRFCEDLGPQLVSRDFDDNKAGKRCIYIYNDIDQISEGVSCKIDPDQKAKELEMLREEGISVLVLAVNSDQDLEQFKNWESEEFRICELPTVFGKWARITPDNFIGEACQLVTNNRESELDNSLKLELLYIDDLAEGLIELINNCDTLAYEPAPVYSVDASEILNALISFRESRKTLVIPAVGKGFLRKLYATYISYLDKTEFSYSIPEHPDNRGNFIELIKTNECGQVSCLTAGPGITRGQHYHHSKSEKFLVIRGKAKFQFRNLLTHESHEIITSDSKPEVVETIPGWVHNITNVSDEEMIVLLWANEVFDPENPDTKASEI